MGSRLSGGTQPASASTGVGLGGERHASGGDYLRATSIAFQLGAWPSSDSAFDASLIASS